MLKNILNSEKVTVIDKKSQQAIQGGNMDWTAYLWCIRIGGNNCNAHIN